MNSVSIVDYGMCNLDSVARAVEECGGVPRITNRARDLEDACRIILPGVGAFQAAMRNIKQRSMDVALQEQVIEKEIPFLGICLGMQLMATKGWEGGETDGLGWIEGDILRLKPTEKDKLIPHVGWNQVAFVRSSPLFMGITPGRDFYFVHSYHFLPREDQDILALTPYCEGIVSAIQRNLMFGVQFHPEKSQRLGFQVIKNFLAV